ncbi:hypothetical protein ACRALDRAFT_207861 [Sodiomyces alcalophilus JCM 7366]|uniref:uncharacterized protein n=1 Tax=Sodiomyces alcalophilus JCM 7366 TaxID=591952 RepID=UPI0039B3BF99
MKRPKGTRNIMMETKAQDSELNPNLTSLHLLYTASDRQSPENTLRKPLGYFIYSSAKLSVGISFLFSIAVQIKKKKKKLPVHYMAPQASGLPPCHAIRMTNVKGIL